MYIASVARSMAIEETYLGFGHLLSSGSRGTKLGVALTFSDGSMRFKRIQ
jgi:hypothetical protein